MTNRIPGLLILGYASASFLAVTITAGSASDAPSPLQTMSTIAASIDANSDNIITLSEYQDFTIAAFISMDTDESRTIDVGEFLEWDMGFAYIADTIGQSKTYSLAKMKMHGVWDADGDAAISLSEARNQAALEYENADADGDGFVALHDLAMSSTSFAALMSAVRS